LGYLRVPSGAVSQAQHPNPQLRAATANALAQIGRVGNARRDGKPTGWDRHVQICLGMFFRAGGCFFVVLGLVDEFLST